MPRFEPHPARRPAVVAGASSGIGAATATELAARGFPVALGARRVDRCEELAARIRAGGGEAVALPLDVTDPEPLPADHPLWRAPNLLLTPHVGGASAAMWPRAHRLVRAQLRRYVAGEPLVNVIPHD